MVTCPICTKTQLVYVRGPSGTSCYYCGAHWVQRSSEPGDISDQRLASAMGSHGTFHPTTEETR